MLGAFFKSLKVIWSASFEVALTNAFFPEIVTRRVSEGELLAGFFLANASGFDERRNFKKRQQAEESSFSLTYTGCVAGLWNLSAEGQTPAAIWS